LNTGDKYDDVLVVLPAYNEANHIEKVIKRIHRFGFTQIVVIDDGSIDNTAELAEAAGAKVLRHIINRGPGAATETGFNFVRNHPQYKYCVTIDADEQHHPKDLSHLIEVLIEHNADMVIGNRFMKGTNNIPIIRVIYNGIANLMTYIFADSWVSDTQSGLKAFKRSALEKIKIKTNGYEFCSELIIKAQSHKLKIIETPITVFYTDMSMKKGQSLGNGFKTVVNLIQSRFFRH
jgi:glycosyltransferase involved in cell wall biosynthesis